LSTLNKNHIYYYGLLFIVIDGALWSGALFLLTNQIKILFKLAHTLKTYIKFNCRYFFNINLVQRAPSGAFFFCLNKD
ncbi:hypothetical protein CNQ79_25570, partial [Bacillus cereus]